VPSLSPGEKEAVLALAAIAAHGTGDRIAALLVSFLARMGRDRIGVLAEADALWQSSLRGKRRLHAPVG